VFTLVVGTAIRGVAKANLAVATVEIFIPLRVFLFK
jgi:hypothetical protein